MGILNGFNHLFLYVNDNPINLIDVTGLESDECCYEYSWGCKKCIKRGPKKLDLDCFKECLANYFPQYAIGGLAAAIMIRSGHVVRGGVLIGAGILHIYQVCYLPCKDCPPIKVKF